MDDTKNSRAACEIQIAYDISSLSRLHDEICLALRVKCFREIYITLVCLTTVVRFLTHYSKNSPRKLIVET